MTTPSESSPSSPASAHVHLKDCALFRGLRAQVSEQICALASEREFAASSTIFLEGEPARELFILAAGKVALDYTLPNDPSVMLPITNVEPGDVFAWSGLAGNASLTARARTLERSKVYVVPAKPLREILASNTEAGYQVMGRLTELVASRLRDTRLQLRWLQSAS